MSIEIKEQYSGMVAMNERLRRSLVHQIEYIVSDNKLTLGVPVESRVKTLASIVEKIERKNVKIRNIVDLDDLVGVRIIFLFRRDMMAIEGLLQEKLNIVSVEDVSARLSEVQFGYQSKHYVVSIPEAWLGVPEFSGLDGLKAEIQIRTMAQHIWAAASHKLQYKNESSVPPPVRRTIHRVSALLETVDLEFDRVLDERSSYVEDLADTTAASEVLNVNLVESLLTELWPVGNMDDDEDYSDLLDDLLSNNVSTVEGLRSLIVNNIKRALRADRKEVESRIKDNSYADEDEERLKRGVFYTHVGLTRQALKEQFGDKYKTRYVKDYLDEL